VLWGLDPDTGRFLDDEHELTSAGLIPQTLSFDVRNVLSCGKKKHTIRQLLLKELSQLQLEQKIENDLFQYRYSTDQQKGKRLLFLFQKDLLPGISGQILASKAAREETNNVGVPFWEKVCSWLFLGALDIGMLFYVFLFAISQEVHRQRAWVKSFSIWIVLDVLVVSSFTVCFMHVFLPFITMRDVRRIRNKLVESLASYQCRVSVKSGNHMGDESNSVFNAARYLFLSHKLALLYPDLRVSKIVQQFSTPWPRQSYQHVHEVGNEYHQGKSGVTRSVIMIAMFFLSSFLTIPPVVQDLVVQCSSTVVAGYLILLHIRLLKIFPVLVVIPALLFIAVIVVLSTSSKDFRTLVDQARLRKAGLSRPDDLVADAAPLAKQVIEAKTCDDLVTDAAPLANQITEAKTCDDDQDRAIPRHMNRRTSLVEAIAVVRQVEEVLAVESSGFDSDSSWSFSISTSED
jgi:hypothetical protein